MATRTAFVFAGGGSLGAVQVGMLRALTGSGIVPDLVVGASVGAINAAYYAGANTSDGVTRLEAVWRHIRRQDVFHFTPAALLPHTHIVTPVEDPVPRMFSEREW